MAQKISMESVVERFSRGIEPLHSPTFTHRCTCPNPAHKQGNERTPSFNFSEESKSFHCFGCKITGDVFDLIALMERVSVEVVVREYFRGESGDLKGILASSDLRTRVDSFDIKHRLGLVLRDFMFSKKGTAEFGETRKWVEAMYRRVDDRFFRMDRYDRVGAQNFSNQILLELERRKAAA